MYTHTYTHLLDAQTHCVERDCFFSAAKLGIYVAQMVEANSLRVCMNACMHVCMHAPNCGGGLCICIHVYVCVCIYHACYVICLPK